MLMTTSCRTTTRHTDHPRPVVVSHRLSCTHRNHGHCFCACCCARAFSHCMHPPLRPPFPCIVLGFTQIYDAPPPDTGCSRIERSRNAGAVVSQRQSLFLCWYYVQGSQAKGTPSRRGRHPRRIETREQKLLPRWDTGTVRRCGIVQGVVARGRPVHDALGARRHWYVGNVVIVTHGDDR